MNKILLIIGAIFSNIPLYAQKIVQNISLQKAIELAKQQSIEAMEAKNSLYISYWNFRNYKASLLPNVEMLGTLPNFNSSYNRYQNPDGDYQYISNRSISENLSISINQNIPLTGGKISIKSELERLDGLGDNKTTNSLSIPASFTYSQPIFTYNSLKWDMKIEPIKNIENQKQYLVNIEDICIKVIQYYFNLLLSKTNMDIAIKNNKNSEELYKIALKKREMGLISENELQQLRYNFINSSASIIESKQDYEQKMFKLRTFLGFNDKVELIPEVPPNAPIIDIHYNDVLSIAKTNNPFSDAIKRRLIDTDKIVAQARSERGPQLDAFLSLGYSGNDKTLPKSYRNLQNRQIISLGVRVPIQDWGRSKGKVIIAKYQKQTEEGRIKRDIQDFEENIKVLVDQIQAQNGLMEIYRLADSIAQNRYKIAFETFKMGKISVLDINAAQLEVDNSARSYINQIYVSWLCHSQLRQVTLFDFVNRKNIINTLEKTEWTEKFLQNLLNSEEIKK